MSVEMLATNIQKCLSLVNTIDEIQGSIYDHKERILSVEKFYKNMFSDEGQAIKSLVSALESNIYYLNQYIKRMTDDQKKFAELFAKHNLETYVPTATQIHQDMQRHIADLKQTRRLLIGEETTHELEGKISTLLAQKKETEQSLVTTFWESHPTMQDMYDRISDDTLIVSQRYVVDFITTTVGIPIDVVTNLVTQVYKLSLSEETYSSQYGLSVFPLPSAEECPIKMEDFEVEEHTYDLGTLDTTSTIKDNRDIELHVEGKSTCEHWGSLAYKAENPATYKIGSLFVSVEYDSSIKFRVSTITEFSAVYDRHKNLESLHASTYVDEITLVSPKVFISHQDIPIDLVSHILTDIEDDLDFSDLRSLISSHIDTIEEDLKKELEDKIKQDVNLDIDLSIK